MFRASLAIVAALTLLPFAAASPFGAVEPLVETAEDPCLDLGCVEALAAEAPATVAASEEPPAHAPESSSPPDDASPSDGTDAPSQGGGWWLPLEPVAEVAARVDDAASDWGDERHADDEQAPAPEPSSEPSSNERREEAFLGGFLPLDLRAPLPLPDLPVDALGLDATLPLPALDPSTDAPEGGPAPFAVASSAVPPDFGPRAPAPVSLPPGAALVAAAIVAASPVATFSVERLRRLGLFALLYTRIAKERLLDHGRREELLDAIRAHPGKAVTDLVEMTGVPRNTAVYHLMRLEREGLVSSAREGRTRLYFAPGSLEQRVHSEAIAALRHDTSRAIAREIGQQPGLDQHSICQKFGIAPPLAHWHADRLVSSGIVEKRREGRRVRYYPGEAFALVGRADGGA